MEDPPSDLSQEIHNLVGANQSFSFCNNGLKLNVSEVFTAVRTSCSGLLCDRQRQDGWNMNNERGCGCYAIHFRRSSIAIQHDIILTNFASPNKDTISMNLFSSYKFTNLAISKFIFISKHCSQSIRYCSAGIFQYCEGNTKRCQSCQQERRFYSNMMV